MFTWHFQPGLSSKSSTSQDEILVRASIMTAQNGYLTVQNLFMSSIDCMLVSRLGILLLEQKLTDVKQSIKQN